MWWAQLLNNIVALLGNGAGGGGSSYESIATVTSSGGVATLSFTSIPSTYVALQLRGSNLFSENGTTGSYAFYIGFNSDTGTNYANHYISGDGATVTAAALTTTTPGRIGLQARSGNTYGCVSIIDIHDYQSTTKNKTSRGVGGFDANGTGLSQLTSSLWMSTSAITSIQLTGNGNWKTGSTFALYGIKG